MPIDLATVNWTFVALMAVLAFVAALLGSLIAFRSRFLGAILPRFYSPQALSPGITTPTTSGSPSSKPSGWMASPFSPPVDLSAAVVIPSPTFRGRKGSVHE
jgi:hypothetical protein